MNWFQKQKKSFSSFVAHQPPSEHEQGDWLPEEEYRSGWDTPFSGDWQSIWQWDTLAQEVHHECQGRVAIIGPPGVGKSLLFNRLRGWEVSWERPPSVTADEWHLEVYGSFLLVDVPRDAPDGVEPPAEILYQLGDPSLLLYMLDATAGVQASDYKWLARLRASGRPVLVILNKCDLIPELAPVIAQADERLQTHTIPISAHTGFQVENVLLPAILQAAPQLMLSLAREIRSLRRSAARKVTRQAALLAGMVSTQPLPLLDIPFQAALQVGVVMRVGAAYGHAPSGGLSREVVATVLVSLGMRYLAQTLLKFVPVLGWVASGLLAGTATLLVGEAALHYYEAERKIGLGEWLKRVKRPPISWPTRPWRKQTKSPLVASEEDIPIYEADLPVPWLLPPHGRETSAPNEHKEDDHAPT